MLKSIVDTECESGSEWIEAFVVFCDRMTTGRMAEFYGHSRLISPLDSSYGYITQKMRVFLENPMRWYASLDSGNRKRLVMQVLEIVAERRQRIAEVTGKEYR